jgi:Fur family ferric uptake transcriptional regulator
LRVKEIIMSHHIEMLQSLRAAGHRLTPQREVVLAVICDSDGHITAEEILKQVRTRYPYLNKSAVYRSLDLLVRRGMLTQTDLGQGRIEYELHRHPHHHHLICRHCGKTEQVEHSLFVPLEKNLNARYGFQADLDHFAIFGTCHKCRNKKSRMEVSRAHS